MDTREARRAAAAQASLARHGRRVGPKDEPKASRALERSHRPPDSVATAGPLPRAFLR